MVFRFFEFFIAVVRGKKPEMERIMNRKKLGKKTQKSSTHLAILCSPCAPASTLGSRASIAASIAW